MLRRKLIVRLGFLVAVLVAVAGVGASLLRGSLVELRRIDTEGPRISGVAQALSDRLALLEGALLQPQRPSAERVARLLGKIEASRAALGAFGDSRHLGGLAPEPLDRLEGLAPVLDSDVRAFVTADHPTMGDRDRALRSALSMRLGAAALGRIARDHAATERASVIARLHRTAAWLGLGVVVVALVAGIGLVTTVRLVLGPVDVLVRASREMVEQRVDARVPADQPGEFGELARAYNELADRVEAGERHTLETLHHMALTLNHELNNALAIVEMQLERLSRRSPDDPTLSAHLVEIRATLDRMTRTVRSLMGVRRIVLTEYVPGQKMFDLERAVLSDEADACEGVTHG